MNRRLLAALLVASYAAGCDRLSDAEALELVRRYDARVVEAFRGSDPKLIDPVTGPEEGRRLTGLIGVKADLGIAMDAELLELRAIGVERRDRAVVVSTEERWHYVERRIGTGEQVGDASDDHYFMRYHLERPEGRWVVNRIEFAREPEVGRKEVPYLKQPHRMEHGVTTPPPPLPQGEAPGKGGP